MSKAVYIQKGESLDYKNSTEAAIAAGDIVMLGSVMGVASCDIPVGAVGSMHVEGVYKLPKTSENAITMGTVVYYDGTGITEAANDGESEPTAYTAVGYAAADAATGDTEIAVKIN